MADMPRQDGGDPERAIAARPPTRSLYLRRAGETRGPFPAGLLARHLELGRLAPEDEASADQVTWQPLGEALHAFSTDAVSAGSTPRITTDGVDWQEERRRARRRWIDERSGTDRRTTLQSPVGSEARTGLDRRRRHDADAQAPRTFGPRDEDGIPEPRRALGIVVFVLVLLTTAGVCLWLYAPRLVPRIQLIQ